MRKGLVLVILYDDVPLLVQHFSQMHDKAKTEHAPPFPGTFNPSLGSHIDGEFAYRKRLRLT